MNITQLLSAMAAEIHDLDAPEQAIDRIGQYARVAVAADGSGILLVSGKQTETASSTSDAVAEAHQLQVALDEGPCLDVIKTAATTLRCDDTSADPRWPKWGPRSSDLGYRSTVSARLQANGAVFGSLNAYSTEPFTFTEDDERTLEFLATHASVAIAVARHDAQMKVALDSRTAIGQAQGMLMLAFGIDAPRAFQYMRRLSQDTNTRLTAVAQQIIENQHDLKAKLQDS